VKTTFQIFVFQKVSKTDNLGTVSYLNSWCTCMHTDLVLVMYFLR